MDALTTKLRRWLLCAISIALVAGGAVGLYTGLQGGFTGGLYDPDYFVVGVMRGSFAERAGFQAGDRVISVEGTPVEELGMESRWPRRLRTRIGQSRRFVVERKGERIPVDAVYPAPSRGAVNNRIAAALTGLAFLAFGVWAFLTVGNAPALTLAYIGLAAGVAMSPGLGPNLGSWNGVKDHISTAAAVLMYILILRFFVTFPSPKRVSGSRLAMWAVCGAWVGLLAFLVAELIVHPALYYSTGSVAYPLMLTYAILILAAIVHTVAKTPRAELSRSGMLLILGGFLVTIVALLAAFAAGSDLPGWARSLMILPIPLTMALAVRKQARAFPPSPADPAAL